MYLDFRSLIAKNILNISIYQFSFTYFQYLWPCIIAIGVTGNIINLIVLTSKDLKLTAKGNKVSQRSKYMFSYMKALAYTDLMYLFMVIQICIFTVQARSF